MKPNGNVVIAITMLMAGLALGGCNRSQTQAALPAGDPANGNLAPADETQQAAPVPAAQQTAAYDPAPPPPQYSAGYQGQVDSYNAEYDSGSQEIAATEPPPPLPEYTQPPCPGENYMWTPGYWDYAPAGYYWVPGVWVVAPYVDALWTPPYWGFYGGRYLFHRGYWGTHVGFYGGVNYGFGYVGRGFYGGYWRNGEFDYNSRVTNINRAAVRNIYSFNAPSITPNRVSYNSGPGGLRVRPLPQELAVRREQRMAPVAAQVAIAREYAGNRAQFAAVNHGHPAEAAAPRPLQTEYRAPVAHPNEVPGRPPLIAPRPIENRPMENHPADNRPMGNRPAPQLRAQAPAQPFQPQAQPDRMNQNQPRPNPFENRTAPRGVEPNRPAPEVARPMPAARQAPAPPPQPRQEFHPAPPAQPRQDFHPAPPPQPRQDFHPAPPPQPRQDFHPAPPAQPRQEFHPAPPPQPRQEAHPAPPAAHPAPQERERKPGI